MVLNQIPRRLGQPVKALLQLYHSLTSILVLDLKVRRLLDKHQLQDIRVQECSRNVHLA